MAVYIFTLSYCVNFFEKNFHTLFFSLKHCLLKNRKLYEYLVKTISCQQSCKYVSTLFSFYLYITLFNMTSKGETSRPVSLITAPLKNPTLICNLIKKKLPMRITLYFISCILFAFVDLEDRI